MIWMGYQASPVIGINLLLPLNAYLENFQELICDRKQVTYFIYLPDLICPQLSAPTHHLKESGPVRWMETERP